MKFSQVHNLPEMKEYRRELRNNATPAERLLWDRIKHSRLEGYKFRRQHSVGNFILDFYCPKYMLAIELDGAHHFEENEKMNDDARTNFLNELNIKVIRFANSEVENNIEDVLNRIVIEINS